MPCPKTIMYMSAKEANRILLFSASSCLCPNIKYMNTYNSNPMIMECNSIIIPLSMIFFGIK